jgi:FixJ family two-component response regulator
MADDPVVYVVDDDEGIRNSLESLIRSVGLSVQTFASPQEFLGTKRKAAGCLVLDVRLPGLSGLDLQTELVRKEIHTPIVFITGHGDIPMSVRAMKAGAVEFLTKPFREQELLEAIQHGIEKHRAARQRNAELGGLRRLYDSLTAREREVFPLVVSGMLNKQVADQLGTSEKTVKVHRGQLMRKMKADSLADLIRMAGRLRLPSPKS